MSFNATVSASGIRGWQVLEQEPNRSGTHHHLYVCNDHAEDYFDEFAIPWEGEEEDDPNFSGLYARPLGIGFADYESDDPRFCEYSDGMDVDAAGMCGERIDTPVH